MKRFVSLIAAIGLVVVFWCAGWLFGSGWVRSQIEAQSADDPAIACDSLSVAGFPFRFDITCTGAQVADADVSITVSEIRASALVYNPTFVEIFAKGPAQYADAFSGSSYRLDWTSLTASARLNWTSLARVSVVADKLVLSDTVLDKVRLADIGHVEFHVLGVDGALTESARNLRSFLRIEDARAPMLEAPLRLETTALVTEWPADVTTWSDPALLRLWAEGEGHIAVESLDVVTGDLSAHVEGVLAPDQSGLFDGDLSLSSRGLGPLLREFLAAPLAGAVLGPEDESGEAHQTLIVSKSVLRAGIVPLIALPPLF